MSNMKHFLENYNELTRDYYHERNQARIWKQVAYRLHDDCYCGETTEHLTALAREIESQINE
jgi:hypothetical protein